MALNGYCGIAQDVRLLYKTLASCQDVEVTGLIYASRKEADLHRFLKPDAPRSDRLANQSEYLWSLADGKIAWPGFRPLCWLKQLRLYLATRYTRRAQLDELDIAMFWPVVWRTLFKQTLSPADLHFVRNGRFLLSNVNGGIISLRGIKNRAPVKVDTRGYDFLIVQGARPFRTSPGTRQIVRYHDMIPVLQPDTMVDPSDIRWHQGAIRQNLGSAFYVCNSEPTRTDLTNVFPELVERSTTIPYMLSEVYKPEADMGRHAVRSIVDIRRSRVTGAHPTSALKPGFRYLMCVSTLEPRKNFIGLIQAFNALRLRPSIRQRLRGLKLLIVGSPGWKYEPILDAMRQLVVRGDLIHLERVSAAELRVLYTHAEAFVFSSNAEGFGFPPLEAMRCGTPVIASDIAAHRWVLGDAALYCNSYDVSSIVAAIERLVATDDSTALRAELVARGLERVKSYSLERCSQQWLELLRQLKGQQTSQPPHVNLELSASDARARAA
jgi:glycosyltransferase involved in cell wall biosynthesis